MNVKDVNSIEKFSFSCIYLWTNLVNGKHYVGQTVNFYQRMTDYKRLCTNRYLQNAFKKYGLDNFDVTVLEFLPPDKEILTRREQFWLDFYHSYKRNKGYNICKHAETSLGLKMSDESKAKMSRARKGEQNPNSRPVICDGVEYSCITEFAEAYNIHLGSAYAYLQGKHGMPKDLLAKGLRYKDNPIEYKQATIGKSVAVICEGVEYSSVKDCANHYGVNARTMYSWVTGENNMPEKWLNIGLRLRDNPIDYKISKADYSHKSVICEGIVYNTITECAKHYGLSNGQIGRWLNGKYKMPQKWREKGLAYYKKINDIKN